MAALRAAISGEVLDAARHTAAPRPAYRLPVLDLALPPLKFAAAQKALDLGAYARTPEGLVAALRGELAARPEGRRRPIGFAA